MHQWGETRLLYNFTPPALPDSQSVTRPFIEWMTGGVTEQLMMPSLLPAVDTSGRTCDGSPLTENLQVTEPPEGELAPPCFSELDGAAIAMQCRCRTLKLAGLIF